MCHLILLLPVIALPVFWLLPLDIALPLYACVLVLSAFLYIMVMMVMRSPVITGKKGLLLAHGDVQRVDGHAATVWINGELWSAVGDDLTIGDTVKVVSIDGLVLNVCKITSSEVWSDEANETYSCH